MLSCKFLASFELLNQLGDFVDSYEISNISVFENPELGFSKKSDENGFPIANFFNVEIFAKDEDESEKIKEDLTNEFKDQIKDFKIDYVKDEDWIEHYRQEVKPILFNGFFIYNENIFSENEVEHENYIPIKLNSALAFGSGHHQTTQGCIANIRSLNKNGFVPEKILDMGCGTGILGICSKKLWPKSLLLGIDIEPQACDITNENYIVNDIMGAIAITGSDILSLIEKQELFDLVLCNILMRPLLDLCEDFSKIIKKDGYIIISGFITNQADKIKQVYKQHEFELINETINEDWSSVLFKKL